MENAEPRILLHSADEQTRATFRELLHPHGNPQETVRVENAVTLVSSHSYDLLVLDVADGAELDQVLAATTGSATPPVVLAVAPREQGESMIDHVDSGAVYRFVLKPFPPGQARLAVDAALRRFANGPETIEFEVDPFAEPDGGSRGVLLAGAAAAALVIAMGGYFFLSADTDNADQLADLAEPSSTLAGSIVRSEHGDAAAMQGAAFSTDPASTEPVPAITTANAGQPILGANVDEATTDPGEATETADLDAAMAGETVANPTENREDLQAQASDAGLVDNPGSDIPVSASAKPANGEAPSVVATKDETTTDNSNRADDALTARPADTPVAAASSRDAPTGDDDADTAALTAAETPASPVRPVDKPDNASSRVARKAAPSPDTAKPVVAKPESVAAAPSVKKPEPPTAKTTAAALTTVAVATDPPARVFPGGRVLETDGGAKPTDAAPERSGNDATSDDAIDADTRAILDDPVVNAPRTDAFLAGLSPVPQVAEPPIGDGPDADAATGDAPALSTPQGPDPLVRTVYIAPEYPKRALQREQQGWVEVSFLIGPDGVPQNVVVDDAHPMRVFERAATRAVRQWRYEPPIEDGEVSFRRHNVRITFSLD